MGIKLVGAQQTIRGSRYTNKNGSHRPELAILDDILSDADAKSPTAIANVENTIYKAVDKALKPGKRRTIYIGTVFNANDPLHKAIESGRWTPSVYPVCEEFPCSREDFKGAWPDRFNYDTVKDMYDDAINLGRPSDFNGEMMNRVMSEEDRLVLDDDIVWYNSRKVIDNKGAYNFYITTDFATSERKAADYSVISVWAYNNNGDWLLVDGVCARQLMNKNIDDLFRLCQEYKPQSVGIEVSGQQGGFIAWVYEQMMSRNIWFTLATDNNGAKAGIRPTTNKMERFNVVLPWFKTKKIWLPEDRKQSKLVAELVEELRFASPTGFKSKHDDVIDTVSMLGSLSPWKPSEITVNDSTGIWEEDAEQVSNALGSYIV